MANVKITELTALTTPAGTDVLPIVDVVSDVTKKITVSDLNAAVGGYSDPLTTDGDIVIRSGGVTTRLGIGSTDQVLKVAGGLPVWAAEATSDVVLDTSPQLGGNLDVNGNYIISASGGNVEIAPDTTGAFVIRGNNTDGSITLNCTANTHGVTIQSPPHASAATYTLILPDDTGTSGQVLSTNGTGTLSWLTATEPGDNISTLTNDSGFITSTVTGDFTVDTDTLYVDSTNNHVGIGTNTNLTAKLTVGTIENSSVTDKGAIAFKTLASTGSVGESAIYIEEQTGSEGWYLKVNSLGDLEFNDSGVADRITFQDGGNVGIGTSPAVALDVNGEVRASTGVLFGTDTAAANTLDDYEEGTWTPGIEGATTAGSYTFTSTGAYTKVGNKVTVWGELTNITTVSAGSGITRVTGLPFTSALGFASIGSIMLDQWNLSSTAYIDVVASISDAVDYMTPRIVRDGATDISLPITNKTNDSADITFCATYTVA